MCPYPLMQNITAIPLDSHELLKLLDSSYPHKCPKPRDTPEDMWRYAGKRELIDLLLMAKNNPSKNPTITSVEL